MAGPKQYHRVAIRLHWAIAGLILVAFGLGLTVDLFPKRWESGIINSHALLGLLALCLSFFRIGWRLTHRVPDLPETIGPLTRVASKAGHAALYILMFLVPLIGIPTLLYRGRGLDLMIFQIASPFERTPAVFRPLTEYHEIAAFALVALAAGHIIAALFHPFVGRNGLLLRMLPEGAVSKR
jgi:cytochrome b561